MMLFNPQWMSEEEEEEEGEEKGEEEGWWIVEVGGGCLAELQTSWLQLAISVGYGLLCLSRETGVNLPLRSLLCTLCDTHLKVNKCFMGQVNEPPSPGLMGACAGGETAPGGESSLSCTGENTQPSAHNL